MIIDLVYSYGPDSVSLTPNIKTHTIDEYAAINDIMCNADCYPACTYVWTKEGHSSQMSTTSVLSFGGRVSRNYTGLYTCIATNIGYNRQGSVVLTIHVRCKYFRKENLNINRITSSRR